MVHRSSLIIPHSEAGENVLLVFKKRIALHSTINTFLNTIFTVNRAMRFLKAFLNNVLPGWAESIMRTILSTIRKQSPTSGSG